MTLIQTHNTVKAKLGTHLLLSIDPFINGSTYKFPFLNINSIEERLILNLKMAWANRGGANMNTDEDTDTDTDTDMDRDKDTHRTRTSVSV
jgi:hypothetical protein